MKVLATLDYWDGRKSITKEVNIETLARSGELSLMLRTHGVASITLTNVEKLTKIAKHLEDE